MNNIKRISIIALLFIIVGVIGSIATFKLSVSKSNWHTLNEEFVADNVENIIIAVDNADIEILPTNDQTVNVEVSGNGSENDLVASVEDETLSIHLNHPRNRLFQFDISGSVSSLKIYVPEKKFASILVESDNGRIKGEGFSAGDIRVKTDNGLIELKHLISDVISVEANNGAIIFKDIEGDIQAKTDNGAITLITDDIDRNIEMSTDIGMIEIKTNHEPTNVEILATVDLGSVSIFGHSNSNTVFGNGEHQIKLTTDIGKIKVE